MAPTSRRSLGRALAPAITLNRMYHWVPSTIRGDSQTSGLSLSATIAITAPGNSTLAGKAARNWAKGWIRSVQAGRSPIQTPIGTQIRLAAAISTRTRIRVRAPSPATFRASPIARVCPRIMTARTATKTMTTATTAIQARSSSLPRRGFGGPVGAGRRGSSRSATAWPTAVNGATTARMNRVRRIRL